MINLIIFICNTSCCSVITLENILEQIFNDLNKNVNFNIDMHIITAYQIQIVKNNLMIINLNFFAVLIYSHTSSSDRIILRSIIN